MMAVTLWQPYASLIAAGVKRFETRSRRPPRSCIGSGVKLAIHAAKAEGMIPCQLQSHTVEAINRAVGSNWMALPRSRVMCVTTVRAAYESTGEIRRVNGKILLTVRQDPGGRVDRRGRLINPPGAKMIEMRRLEIELPGDEYWLGNFGPDRWLWDLRVEHVFANPPPAKGHQFVWDWKEAFEHA